MISGIGTDIVEIKKLENYGKSDSFLNKTFTQNEINYAKSKENFYTHLATTFAAKEAIFKALGTGWIEGKEIEIARDSKGRPSAILFGKSKKLLKKNKILLSLSYNNNSAIAFAIIK